jgi:hypothetical protein
VLSHRRVSRALDALLIQGIASAAQAAQRRRDAALRRQVSRHVRARSAHVRATTPRGMAATPAARRRPRGDRRQRRGRARRFALDLSSTKHYQWCTDDTHRGAGAGRGGRRSPARGTDGLNAAALDRILRLILS